MNRITSLLAWFDKKQQHTPWLGFLYAIIKKYGEDQAGHQAALLTYYAFLSLFPLLLVLTTILSVATGSHHALQSTILRSLTNYIPTLGSQISAHVHSIHKSGVALIVGIVFTIYGARGVADAFRYGVNHIWLIPLTKRDGFPKTVIKSLSIIAIGGVGFMSASLLAGYAGAVGQGITFRVLSLAVNVFILFILFSILLNLSLPRHVTLSETRAGALVAAFGLVILQSAGTYLLARELKNLDSLYSTFALPLGLLFWLYLQSQVLYYAVVVSVVQSQHLYPRAVNASLPTEVDKQVMARLAGIAQVLPKETIKTTVSP